MIVATIIAWALASCAALAALSRWEERRAKRRLSPAERWARIATGGAVHWK